MNRTTSRRAAIGLICAVALTVCGVARAGKYDTPSDAELGFIGQTRAETLASLKRIALVTHGWPVELAEREDARATLTSAMTKQLRASRFDVIDGSEFTAIFQKRSVEAGGLYDTNSGAIREDVEARVLNATWCEYAARENLDGIAFLRVVKRPAQFYGGIAKWDGVFDDVNATAPDVDYSYSFKKHMKSGGGNIWMSSGTTNGLSISLTVLTREGDVVFIRRAGLQLESYFVGGDFEFRAVAPNDLLRDPVRIDRAVAIVAAPLRYPPEKLARAKLLHPTLKDVYKLPKPPAVSPAPLRASLLIPRSDIVARVRRIAISPLQAGGLWLPEESRLRIEQAMQDDLQSLLGMEIIDTPELRAAMQRILGQRGMFDPRTGKFDVQRASDVRKNVFRELGAGAKPDAILYLVLERTKAKYSSFRVSWDGAYQDGRHYNFELPRAQRNSIGGELAAVSIAARLFDADDRAMYDSRGGLNLLEIVVGNGVVPLPPSRQFVKKEYETVAARAVLNDLLLNRTPEMPSPEVHQDAPAPGR